MKVACSVQYNGKAYYGFQIQKSGPTVQGEIEIRPMMYVALTYDHRIIDGSDAVQFLVSIKNSLEDPGRLLLQI